MKTALITGITGLDGTYLRKLLLEKNYKVYGVSRKNTDISDCKITVCDITNFDLIYKIITEIQPDEIYHLASTNSISNSLLNPINSMNVDSQSTVNILESVRRQDKKIRVFNASSSEIFGNVGSNTLCNEETRFNPNTPYGISKEFAYRMCKFYREMYGVFVCNGILFNHDSPLRQDSYVIKKILNYVTNIENLTEKLKLGNLDIYKDRGYADDFVLGMWLMLQHEKPDDYILATGNSVSVRDICKFAFNLIGIRDYKQYIEECNDVVRVFDNSYVGDYSKAYTILGWTPKYTIEDVISMMIKQFKEIELRNH